MTAQCREFVESVRGKEPSLKKNSHFDLNWLLYQSDWPWIRLLLDFPYEKMLREARSLKSEFVAHRKGEEIGSYLHSGWKSLCLHGLGNQKTENFQSYGYNSVEEAPYDWTEAAQACPVTVDFLMTRFPFARFQRVRFMLLEAGGYINPHTDQQDSSLYPINMALNNPIGCQFAMEGQGLIPFDPGSSFLLNLSYRHAVYNSSAQDRYHLIVHGDPGKKHPDYMKLLERSFNEVAKSWIF